MCKSETLPEGHLHNIRALESAYLKHRDPIRQSGFSGGAERWRAERSPLLKAVHSDGEFLDVGCSVGYLLHCVVEWSNDNGLELVPYGVDLNPRLILEALRRFPGLEHHFWVANAWRWVPPRRFKWVYALSDCVPKCLLIRWSRHMLQHAVAENGRLIIGHYGSRSVATPPLDIAEILAAGGLDVSGEASGGKMSDGSPVTRFAWMDRRSNLR